MGSLVNRSDLNHESITRLLTRSGTGVSSEHHKNGLEQDGETIDNGSQIAEQHNDGIKSGHQKHGNSIVVHLRNLMSLNSFDESNKKL